MKIVVSGSIAYDYLMTFPGRFTDQIIPDKLARLSVSFLVDEMVRQRGGTAANIAYSLKLLGGDPILLGTVGQDFGDYAAWLRENGIRTDHIVEIPHKFTASFFVSTDEDQNQIANFYAGAMTDCREISLADRGLTGADVVIISPNDPQAMLKLHGRMPRPGHSLCLRPQPADRPAQRRGSARQHPRRSLADGQRL